MTVTKPLSTMPINRAETGGLMAKPQWRQRSHEFTRSPLTLALAAALVGGILVLLSLWVRDARAGDRFDLVRWQVDTFSNRWVTLAGASIRERPDADEVIRSYFAVPSGDPVRQALQADLQLIVEGRIDAVLHDLGLNARIRIPGSVFPPVNIQIAEAPQVLVTSPRSVIRREGVVLLRPDLPPGSARDLEAGAETSHTSAIVLPSGGLATYPAVVADRGSYEALLRVAAHEWAHHYLVFYPLGIRYFQSADMVTINETVADIVGDEVAALVLERWGDPTEPAPAASRPALNVSAVLRDLRVEVDALLDAREVEAAEQRMAEVRDELEQQGVRIRRINQAYFAWFGYYAARPDAVDPVGRYLIEIRERSGSLPAFMELVRGFGSRDAVEASLVALGGTSDAVPGTAGD